MSRLIAALDALGPAPSLRAIHAAVDASGLAPSDVAPWVRTDTRRYFRNRVTINAAYELLVMTWLPGQSSVPHDHAGSVCAMRVVEGRAVERAYELCPDGSVRESQAYEVNADTTISGEDAAVHSIHNDDPNQHTLVTVHVYSPPLKDFRRFVARPASSREHVRGAEKSSEASVTVGDSHEPRRVCIIGGGFSGAMTAANLARVAAREGVRLHVTIVERRGSVGDGVAYSTTEDAHLLNVPAGRMSAWPDDPEHFLRWARQHRPEAQGGDFLPRKLYGAYTREALREAAQMSPGQCTIEPVFDEARRAQCREEAGGAGWMVHLAQEPSVRADALVLALGHRPPTDPLADRWSGPRHRFIADPWRPFAVHDIRPDEAVLVLGSGLTSIDVILSLCDERAGERTAPIYLASRRSLFPQSHLAQPNPAMNLDATIAALLTTHAELSATDLVRCVRELVRGLVRGAERGGGGSDGTPDWRPVIDGLRPHTSRLWARLSLPERKRFLEHARAFWEVHRHRMAPAIGARISALGERGVFTRLAGRVTGALAEGESVNVQLRLRGSDEDRRIRVAWVINCTGPSPSNKAEASPIIASMLDQGAVVVDELGLGLRTNDAGWAIDAHGHNPERVLIVGTLRKPMLWESTAVPELRAQASAAAEAIVARLRV